MAKKRVDPKLPIVPIAGSGIWSRLGDFFKGFSADHVWAWLMRPDAFGDRLLRRLNELFREQDDGTIAVFDEEVYIGQASGLNFTGAGVTASQAANLPIGNYDITIPGGGGSATAAVTPFITAEAHEALAAGQFVAVYNDGGVAKCRVSKSSSGQGYQADGWVDASYNASVTATIYLPGTVNSAGGSGLDAGDVWLGTDGYATSTPPTTAGYISQQIGVAESGVSVAFEPHPDILIEATATAGTGGQSTSVTTTTTTTIVVPGNVTGMLATMVGGGGGGRASTSATDDGGGGGGAGEYCIDFPIPVVAGETLTLTIGSGGLGGATAGAAGADGGTTSVAGTYGTFAVVGGRGAINTAGSTKGGDGGGPRGATGGASGGAGGVGALGTAESPCHFGGSSGGGGATGAVSDSGAGGGAPGRLTGGAAGTSNGTGNGGGGGAATIWGTGGAGGNGGAAGNNAAASSYGAGGGGGGGDTGVGQFHAGGNGAPGWIMLNYVA